MFRSLPLVCLLAALSVACGDDGGLPTVQAAEGGVRALATATVTTGGARAWRLPEDTADVIEQDGRTWLLVRPGEEPVSVGVPIPADAAGSGHVVVRTMSDGPFGLRLDVGERETRTVRSGDTRRRWKEMTFSLGRPLVVDEGGATLEVVRVEGELPVVIEAVRFLP
jgi:hypothetical protein